MTVARRPSGRLVAALWRLTAGVAVAALVLCGSVGSAGAQSGSSPEELRQTADDVMARQEFQRPEPTLLERVQEWVGERLGELFEGLTGGGAGSLIGWIILVAAIGALIWSLTRLGRSVRADPALSARVRIDQGRTPDAWRAEAEGFEAEGRWKEALRCRYRALLGDLVRAGVIDDVPGRTTGEYRREVDAGLPAASGSMDEATELFELAWYADRPTGPDESRRFRDAAESVISVSVDEPARDAAGVG